MIAHQPRGMPLLEVQLLADPIAQFSLWYAEAAAGSGELADAMTLATAANGQPSCRIVYLRGHGPSGFAFFTNYHSRKGRELVANPHAALCFFWPQLLRQVRIEGKVETLPAEHSDAYFRNRPRDSQLGAWASPQSDHLDNRADLEERFRAAQQRFAGQDVPRPPHWGGYLLVPRSIEFWQAQPGRLHDRIRYQHDGTGWRRERLAP